MKAEDLVKGTVIAPVDYPELLYVIHGLHRMLGVTFVNIQPSKSRTIYGLERDMVLRDYKVVGHVDDSWKEDERWALSL